MDKRRKDTARILKYVAVHDDVQWHQRWSDKLAVSMFQRLKQLIRLFGTVSVNHSCQVWWHPIVRGQRGRITFKTRLALCDHRLPGRLSNIEVRGAHCLAPIRRKAYLSDHPTLKMERYLENWHSFPLTTIPHGYTTERRICGVTCHQDVLCSCRQDAMQTNLFQRDDKMQICVNLLCITYGVKTWVYLRHHWPV
jgi:hypothetical protein